MSDVLIGIACEDGGHFSVVTTLVDGALIAAHDWLDGIIANCRSWRGIRATELWYKYDPEDGYDVRPITIDGLVIKPQGHIGGEPLKAEAGMWRRILFLFHHSNPRPEIVILVRDMDGYDGRRAGLVQVRDGLRWPFKIVLATAQPEIEAWHVAGFVPGDGDELERLNELRKALSFDPVTASHRLTSHPNDARTDAKRVLNHLCQKNHDRREACLADRAILCRRGEENGLTTFLDEVDQHIVPAFGGPP